MPVTIDEWKTHAESICSNNEIGVRCLAARKYYVAYHSANTLVDGLMEGAGGGLHEQLINTLVYGFVSDENSTEYKKIGYKLRAAKTLRAKADYKLDAHFSAEELKSIEEYVEFIVDAVDKLKAVA